MSTIIHHWQVYQQIGLVDQAMTNLACAAGDAYSYEYVPQNYQLYPGKWISFWDDYWMGLYDAGETLNRMMDMDYYAAQKAGSVDDYWVQQLRMWRSIRPAAYGHLLSKKDEGLRQGLLAPCAKLISETRVETKKLGRMIRWQIKMLFRHGSTTKLSNR